MLVKSYTPPEAASERYALFYVREINHLIPSGQCQIDEIRCPAKLWILRTFADHLCSILKVEHFFAFEERFRGPKEIQ